MKNKSKTKSFVVAALPCFIIGIILGVLTPLLMNMKFDFCIDTKKLLNTISYVIAVISTILWIIGIVLATKSDKQLKNNKDEDNIEKIEKRLDIAVILFNFSILFIFLASSLLFNGTKDADMNMAEVIFTLVFIIICLSSSYMEYKVVNIIKTINPEKKGKPKCCSIWYIIYKNRV